MLKKFILFLFISISSIIYANNLSRDIDIVGMPLHDVLAILSKESGKNLISSKETKDIIVDTYFLKGDDFDRVLNSLAVSYDLTFSKVDDTIIFMLPSEKNNKKAKIIGQVFSGNKILPDVKIEILLLMLYLKMYIYLNFLKKASKIEEKSFLLQNLSIF